MSQPGDPGYAELLADICEREKIDAALVGPEAEVLFWSGREFPVPTLLPPPGLVAIAISKGKLYEALRETGLVPRYRIVSRDELLERRGLDLDGGPVWLRDYSEASSSGIGSMQVTEPEEAYAWAYLNPGNLELHGRRAPARTEHRLLAPLSRGRAAQGGLLRAARVLHGASRGLGRDAATSTAAG